jgi:gamma-glutamyltranspeptidase/glutathione hydrolase
VLALSLGGCSVPALETGSAGFVQGFLGGVIADEPRAALIGREVLSAGGTAADAAVATALALSVTLPSRAGLAGGVCLVHRVQQVSARVRTATVEMLDFTAKRSVLDGTARPSAVPGTPRGLFALHAKYGRLRWAQVISAAETLARFGVPVSRAFARDLDVVAAALVADSEARKVFARADGTVLRESDLMVQAELSTTLSLLRAQGPGPLFSGAGARRLSEAAVAAGGTLSPADLVASVPQWRGTVTASVGRNVLHFAPLPAAGGVVQAQIWNMLLAEDRYEDADAAGRAHLLAEAAMRAQVDLGRWRSPDGTANATTATLVAPDRAAALMRDYDAGRSTPVGGLAPQGSALLPVPASTGLVAVDREGNAVACALTMNNLFGTGRVAPGTGLLLAAAPGGRIGPPLLGPTLMVNPAVSEFVMAAVPSGGRASATAMSAVIADLLLGGTETLAAALDAPRIHRGATDTVLTEPNMPSAVVDRLRDRGHQTALADSLGQVNAAYCPGQLPVNPGSCRFRADRRGFGLAATAVE